MSVAKAVMKAARLAGLGVLLTVLGPAVHAQQASPGAMATAKQLIVVTGATALFNPLIAGVVEQAKLLFLQQNPALAKDLNEVASKMRVSKMTVYRLVHGGELPAVRVGRSFRVTEDDVNEYLRKSFYNAG